MPTVDIDRDTAHELAQRELAKPIYPRPSLTDRITEWLDNLINQLIVKGGSIPGGWFTIAVLVILVAVAFVVAVRIARRTMRTNRGTGAGLFGAHELSAAEHRATAKASPHRAIGPRRSGTGYGRWPASWKKPAH